MTRLRWLIVRRDELEPHPSGGSILVCTYFVTPPWSHDAARDAYLRAFPDAPRWWLW
jgi:hypothetical protein